jgi:ATP-binding cassette subfamily B protein
VEREAFARAWRFLNYQPLAKWTAMITAVGTAVLYLILLIILGLFVDLVVNRGRVPSHHDLSPPDRETFRREWIERESPEDRKSALDNLGIDERIGAGLSKADSLEDLAAEDQELAWRAHVSQVTLTRIGPVAAALLLPEFPELSPRAQNAFLENWKELHENERKERLDLSDIPSPLALKLVKADTLALPSSGRFLIWRAHLRNLLSQRWPEAAEAYWRDRENRAPITGDGEPTADAPLVDRGILSLIVRSDLHMPDRLASPALGGLARLFPWTWEAGDAAHPTYGYYLRALLLLAVTCALIRALAMFITVYSAARATVEATNRLRRAVYHHTYRLGTLAFRALGPGEAVGIFTRQLEAVHDSLYTWLAVMYREPVKFCLLLAFALALNLWLALVFLIFAVLVWLIGGQVAAYYRRQERAGNRRAAEQLAMLQESLMLMRLVKGYLMELFNQARVERQLAGYADAQMRRYRGEAIYRPLLTFLASIAAAILLYVTGLIIINGGLGVPRAILMATALASLYLPLVHWLENRRSLRRGRAAAVILFKFLDRPGEVGQVVGAEFLAPLSNRLEFQGVSLKEPGTGRTLLENVNVTIQAGQRVALVGPDDMEKHAFIYLIARLLDPDSGEIRIDDRNLRWVTFDSLRAQVAIVLQHHLVFNDTVANNIGCGDPSFGLPKVIDAAKIAHAHHFIQKLPKGYETQIGEMGHALNTGEQFRIALARAILRDPALLIIEEPESMLDDDTKALLDDTFGRILPGRTVIFLPHRISTIRRCERIFLLHKGRIEAAGEHRELLTQSELYRHLQYLEFNIFADQV